MIRTVEDALASIKQMELEQENLKRTMEIELKLADFKRERLKWKLKNQNAFGILFDLLFGGSK